MRIDPTVIDSDITLRRLVRAMQRDVALDQNIACAIVNVADTGTIDTSFTVAHNLGRVPITYFWNISKSGLVYDYQRSLWTTTQLTLKCSAANASLTLVIF